jgi:general stress protein YciG
MAGTKDGGARAAATNKAKYGADFYARIGASGGKVGRTGGFYANRDLARKAGAKGGRLSRRGPSKKASTNSSAVVSDNSTDE